MIGDVIGKPLDRKDGILKVTGRAKYAAEFTPKDVVYAFPVRAKIASGTISSIDTTAAKASPGVIQVLTHQNAPRLTPYDQQAMARGGGGMLGETQVLPLQQNKVFYFGQYVAVVIADTFENARAGANLVKVDYADSKPAIDLDTEMPNAQAPAQGQTNEGKASPVIASSEIRVDNVYRTPTENHHPMEPHATVAVWESPEKLTIYDSTQGVKNCQGSTAYLFGLKPENVHVISPFVGGGFGCKGGQWPHIAVAVMSAKAVGRPVKLNITRQLMVTNVGRRPKTIQHIALGADKSGKMTALLHHTDTYKSVSDFFERAGVPSTTLYGAPIREITYKVAKLNVGAPTFMRAPGETPGSFALESAMDELAFALNMDPIALRVLNHTSTDPLQNKPFSLDNLLDCYRIGAEKFGWSKRNARPTARREGRYLYGIGMATATYPANRSRASARIQIKQDGTAEIWCASQDIGTGTYTIIAQTAADVLGIPMERIKVNIGDSLLPQGPGSGGSQTAVSVTSAVLATAQELKKQLAGMAVNDPRSRLHGHGPENIDAADSRLYLRDERSINDTYTDILKRANLPSIEMCLTVQPFQSAQPQESNPQAKQQQQSQQNQAKQPAAGGAGAPCEMQQSDPEADANRQKYSFHSFGAQFAEVRVDVDTGMPRVTRFLSVMDIGRVLNEKTARSQIIGGVVYGLGQVLMEETAYDKRWANPVSRTLADYHVPVNLDVPEIDVYFIGKPDPHISPIGARGIGEIGITGVAGAVANAIFNATGKRIRDLPITPDKLL